MCSIGARSDVASVRTQAESHEPAVRPWRAVLLTAEEHAASLHAAPRRRSSGRAFAICWVTAIALVFLGPALAHGLNLGPYDILDHLGLTANTNAPVHNVIDSDEIEEFIPWQMLSWLQVHGGHLPLWNPYSLLGLPLAFNFQSAPFSLSIVAGYLAPLRFAHTVTILVRLLIAGGGVLALCRALRMRLLSALVAATIFELSGGFTIWLGSYEAGCLGWMGWVLAASVLILRGRHRVRDVALLAIAFALLLYAGEPQIAFLALGALVIFSGYMTVSLRASDPRRARRAALDHLLGVLGGTALAAPIYLPGMQLALSSVRASGPPVVGLPLYDLTHLIFSGYNGTPTNLANLIGPDNLYVSMIYVGVIGVVLAGVALSLARLRKEVVAFYLMITVLLMLVFASPVVTLLQHVAYLRAFRILLATTLIDFALAMLAGLGCEALLLPGRAGRVPAQDRLLALCVAVVTAVLAVLGVRLALNVDHLTTAQLHARALQFVWPVAEVVALAVVVVVRRRTRGRRSGAEAIALGGLLVVETVFLLAAGSGFVSSSSGGIPTNSATAKLESTVGSAVLGIGSCATNSLPSVGLASNSNLAYAVDEFAVLDPILPSAYDDAYERATGSSLPPSLSPSLFCPAMTSAALAREFGVSYILEAPGAAGPKGTVPVVNLDGEELYRVPNSGRATIVPIGKPSSAAKVVRHLTVSSPTTWRLTIDPHYKSLLQLRLTNVPGWEATIDGRPLKLHAFDTVMLQAVVPAGRSVIQLVYRPRAFTIGIYLALGALLALVSAFAVVLARRRGGSPTPPRLSVGAGGTDLLAEARPLVEV